LKGVTEGTPMHTHERKPGRPKGAKTKGEVTGRKRAKKFLDLKFDEHLQITEAAFRVGNIFDVEPYQIHKDVRRHEATIAADVFREAEELERQLLARKAIIEMGPHPLTGRAEIFHILAIALRGQSL
jgi:hypothetical protein